MYAFFGEPATFIVGADASFHSLPAQGPPPRTALLHLQAGDVLLLPSGYSHCTANADGTPLAISGPDPSAPKKSLTAYPKGGQKWDLQMGTDVVDDSQLSQRIRDRLKRGDPSDWPKDPVWGDRNDVETPVQQHWTSKRGSL